MMIYDDVKFVDSKKKLVSIETNNKRTKGQTTSITENYLKKQTQHVIKQTQHVIKQTQHVIIYRLSVNCSRLLAFAHFVL